MKYSATMVFVVSRQVANPQSLERCESCFISIAVPTNALMSSPFARTRCLRRNRRAAGVRECCDHPARKHPLAGLGATIGSVVVKYSVASDPPVELICRIALMQTVPFEASIL